MSGDETTLGLFSTELSGPSVLTGGEFGLELSIVSVAVYIIVTILFLKYPGKGKVSFLRPDRQD
jgi:hypothetical protein